MVTEVSLPGKMKAPVWRDLLSEPQERPTVRGNDAKLSTEGLGGVGGTAFSCTQPVLAAQWDVKRGRVLSQCQHCSGTCPRTGVSPLEAGTPDKLPAGPAQPRGAGPGSDSTCD